MIRMYLLFSTLMVLLLLAGCGPNVAIGGTGLSITATNRSSMNTANDLAGAGMTGPVTLQTNARVYRIKDTVVVTVSNRSNQTIFFPDHLTNCTVILLQRLKVQPLARGNWLDGINPCRLEIVTRLHSLGPGQRLVVRLVALPNGWPTGFYRAVLGYFTSNHRGSTIISSAVFTVAPLVPQL